MFGRVKTERARNDPGIVGLSKRRGSGKSIAAKPARMSNLARQEMYFDHFYGMDELIAKIESVTTEEVQELSNEFFKTEAIAVTVLGNLNGLKLTREQLAC